MIYVFGLLVGYLPNGVDNAQGYRAKMLEEYSDSIKYIFVDLPSRAEVNYYEKLGIKVSQMMGVHTHFTDNRDLHLKERVDNILKDLKSRLLYTSMKVCENEIILFKDSVKIASVLKDTSNNEYFLAIKYYINGNLVRTEHYTDGVSFVDYYVTCTDGGTAHANFARRAFYNRDGSIAYEQLILDGKLWYVFPDGRRYSKSEFIGEFIRNLKLTKQDLVLIDRPSGRPFVQPLFQFGNQARLITVAHSGHYFQPGEDTSSVYMNYEHYYWFKYSHYIDTMIVSTKEQKTELISKLQEYSRYVPHIRVIPAGGVDCIRRTDQQRKRYSMLTVSRLDQQKRVEWLIKSVIKAHEVHPEISLDIYGTGVSEYQKYLQNIVSENNADAYIHFMGQQNVTEIYKNYEVYISASVIETLGLTLMEAVSSGNAMIGLDVKYGNRLFIKPEKNGYLVDFDLKYINSNDAELINRMADKIIEIFHDRQRLERYQLHSYEIAEKFRTPVIKKKWEKLLFEENIYDL